MRLPAASIAVASALLAVAAGCRSTTATDRDPARCAVPRLDDHYATPPPLFDDTWAPAPACAQGRYPVIIILGCPANDDGTPSTCQRERIGMALQLADAGYADTFITTGGAVQNAFVEAETLRDLLVAGGVAGANVVVEPQAEHTDENLYYSARLMQARGWRVALVVSDQVHLGFSAVCDSDCCVKLGRLTLYDFPVAAGTLRAGHYLLAPDAPAASAAECEHLDQGIGLCPNLPTRRACADNFLLPTN